ncbi:MAG TPA: hypothetical protein VJ801_06840 [Polyangia bacterium]|nr:hypothetical protein [Polyangia bacterium]
MNGKAFFLSLIATFCLLGGQLACGMRSTLLPGTADELQAPTGAGGGQTTGAGGNSVGVSSHPTGGAGGNIYAASGGAGATGTCVGLCSSTTTQTSSGTMIDTSTASTVATSTQTETGIATSIQTVTATATATTPGGFTVSAGGYVTSGSWQGYAWTGTESPSIGSAIAPASFSTLPASGRLCAKGTVGPAWEAVGILGVNVNESMNGVASVWNPDSSGLTYDVTNSGGSALRIQIQGAAGWPSEAWCAIITGTSGRISWNQFNSACWDGTGSRYNGTPLQSVMILVPGSLGYSVPFSFCLNSIGPI